jgi:hypothetical protein
MKTLCICAQLTVADPLQLERVLKALTIILEHQVVVTGEEVDIHFVLPFDSTPQRARHLPPESEGTPGHFYRLRLAHFEVPFVPKLRASTTELVRLLLTELAAPLADRFIGHDDATGEQERFHIAVAEAEAELQPDAMADDLGREAAMLTAISGWCVHGMSIAPQQGARQVAQQVDNAKAQGTSGKGPRV